MPVILSWNDIALRLACTLIAGILVGIDRDEKGRAAGMRTTVLVCLAASLSMILTNTMLDLRGKTPDSFAVMDLMRLPLGILSGMGFIGAGAILRKGDMVLGVTTAATLWMITVVGLCFGGGYIALGFAGLVLSLLTLWPLKWLERSLPQEQRASLLIVAHGGDETAEELRAMVKESGMGLHASTIDVIRPDARLIVECELRWRGRPAWDCGAAAHRVIARTSRCATSALADGRWSHEQLIQQQSAFDGDAWTLHDIVERCSRDIAT